MYNRSILIKDLLKPIPNSELDKIVGAIFKFLPNHFTMNGKPFSKKQVKIVKNNKMCGLILDHAFVFGQFYNNNANYMLISQLNHDEYQQYILNKIPKNSTVYLDLICYNLISDEMIDDEKKRITALNDPSRGARVNTVNDTSLKNIIETQDGTIYFHNHLDKFSWEYVIDEINNLDDNEVSFCYLELPNLIYGPLLHQFNESGDRELLYNHLQFATIVFPEIVNDLVSLCEACFKKKIRLYPTDLAINPDGVDNAILIDQRDLYNAKMIIENNMTHSKKFIGLFGLNHNKIPEMLNVPSIGIFPKPNARKLSLDPNKFGSFDRSECEEMLLLIGKFTAFIQDRNNDKSHHSALCAFSLFAIAAAMSAYSLLEVSNYPRKG